MKDHYQTLGVPRTASSDEIRDSYRRHALRHHPDQHPELEDSSEFRAIQEAYEVLGDPELRRSYDQRLNAQAAQPPEPPPFSSRARHDAPPHVWPNYAAREAAPFASGEPLFEGWSLRRDWPTEQPWSSPGERTHRQWQLRSPRIHDALIRALLEDDDWFF